MARALDIFDLLKRIDSGSSDVYAELTEEQRKEFAPFVVARWMAGTNDERQLMMLNEFVNPYVFALGSHPHLLCKLLQVAASGGPKRYQWTSLKSEKSRKLSSEVISQAYDMSLREVALLNPFPADNEVMYLAESLGWQKEDMAKLKKELNGAK